MQIIIITSNVRMLSSFILCLCQKKMANTFPSAWNNAMVTPVHKAGSPHKASNCRPISILPKPLKVTEKIVVNQLTSSLNINNCGIHPMQFGFRPNHFTKTAILHLIRQVKARLDKGGVVGAVFLDFRKAFDTVKHNVLLSLSSSLGVPQGSVLGPLLFSLYMNDLLQQCHGLEVQMYADDMVLYTHAKTTELVDINYCHAKDHRVA